jgi:hypothetical protein
VGLWRRQLIYHLAWESKSQQKTSASRSGEFPSWTWLSITHSAAREVGNPLFRDYERHPERFMFWKARILNINVAWSGTALSSKLTHGILTIRGRFTKDAQKLHILFDISEDFAKPPQDCEIFALWIERYPNRHRRIPDEMVFRYYYLAVAPTGNREGEYRRIGSGNREINFILRDQETVDLGIEKTIFLV